MNAVETIAKVEGGSSACFAPFTFLGFLLVPWPRLALAFLSYSSPGSVQFPAQLANFGTVKYAPISCDLCKNQCLETEGYLSKLMRVLQKIPMLHTFPHSAAVQLD